MAVRRGIDEALAPQAPSVAPNHVRGGAGLTEEHEPLRVHVPQLDSQAAAVLGDLRPIVLGPPHI